ncbi:MAG: PQQ-binding-like beta-propeller repeat protein, partial [Planctomycetaceae bacterium]|nr:PQQ-binding-like beta-propeller repeat protein [Planctomycetaceae bacterium]
MPRIFCLQVGFCFLLMFSAASAEDWNRFRGANGSGVTSDAAPTEWSATKNMAWSINLPGRGVSSPIIVGDKVFVTCYSGYGIPGEDGQIEDLKRHLVCVNRSNGTVLWTATIPAELPEDPYSGAGVPSHGYASHTPTSDGERVYVFFGKSGALAFDLEGNKLWQTNLGKESGRMRWGSAASPILVNELLVVNASEESEALVGLNAKTGEEVWRAEAAGMAGTWSTPAVATANGEQEIVLAVPYEVWGFNPVNGKLKWYAPGTEDQTMSASVITDGDVVYAMGGRGGNSIAVRAGGKGDVAATNVVWEGSA